MPGRYFVQLFRKGIQAFVDRLVAKQRPKVIAVCMLYYLDEQVHPDFILLPISAKIELETDHSSVLPHLSQNLNLSLQAGGSWADPTLAALKYSLSVSMTLVPKSRS